MLELWRKDKNMKSKKMDRENFCEVMNKIQEVDSYHDKLNQFFVESHVDGYLIQPNCVEIAIELLECLFEDVDNWISYYVFELNWGSRYKPGCVTEEDGENIALNSLEHLYDFLIRNKERLKEND
jgi:hypothetical protein